MAVENQDTVKNGVSPRSTLEHKLDSLGWGLFLIMIGGLWLLPADTLPEGSWLVGTGVIILGLALVRNLNGLKVSVFWVILGLIGLGSGLATIFAFDLPVFPILLIIVGLSILFKPHMRK